MFNIVAKPKPGQCAARRCKGLDVTETGPGTGIFLCVKHGGEWQNAGCPDLTKPPAPTGTAMVPPETQAELTLATTEAEQALFAIRELRNDTQEEIDMLGQYGQLAREQIKILEDKRKTVTGPLNKAVKEVNSWFKPAVSHFQECVKILNEKVLEAATRAQLAQDAALEQIEGAGGVVDETTLVVAHNPVELPDGASYRETADYEITELDRVPRELCSPDPAKIKLFAEHALGQGIKEAPGLRFFMKKILTQKQIWPTLTPTKL